MTAKNLEFTDYAKETMHEVLSGGPDWSCTMRDVDCGICPMQFFKTEKHTCYENAQVLMKLFGGKDGKDK